MKTEWNLEVIYKGYEDPQYAKDVEGVKEAYKALHETVLNADKMTEKERIESILKELEEISLLSRKVGEYIMLRQATNTKDGFNMAQMAALMKISSEGAADESAARKLLGECEDPDQLAEESEIIKNYVVLIKDAKEEKTHMLPDEVESMISAMDMTGGSAWGNLQSFMTSTLKVDYRGEKITLSEARNLAYDSDPAVRHDAYLSEIAAYQKVEDAIAFALNNIKNQVTMLSKKRGYESPLQMTLSRSKMKRETLDAMIEAIKDYLPEFRKYLRKKGELLGDMNGLKWENLFAPLGASSEKFTVEEAREKLVSVFEGFTPEMSEMMARAFDDEWIDFFPKEGKEGGAFCGGNPSLRQSRILTNFDGTFGAVDTLAHELGHAFHNEQQFSEPVMNQDSSMQVAETASTFNEIFLCSHALKEAKSREERLALLENDLREVNQCVVDIYSRYLFETSVFEEAQERFLMAEDMKALMTKAQEASYGDGLDPDFLHPYMWACKGHYYSSGLSFYNFPYAFGNLFAQGLYALYLKDKEGFLPKYKNMLRTTGVHSVEECGEMMGVDLSRKDFWVESLKVVAEEIEEFCAL